MVESCPDGFLYFEKSDSCFKVCTFVSTLKMQYVVAICELSTACFQFTTFQLKFLGPLNDKFFVGDDEDTFIYIDP